MNLDSWNLHYNEASRKSQVANDDPMLYATKHMTSELLEFVLNNDYPGPGAWMPRFVEVVKRELENRVSNILLEK